MSTTERDRAVSNAYSRPAYSVEKPKFLDSSQLEGWIPKFPVLNGATRSHSASEKPQQNGISHHANNNSNLDHESMVFPPEVSSNSLNKDAIRAPSVNEMILQELAKAVTDELVGPEYTPVTKEDVLTPAEAIVSQQNNLREEKREDDKKVKMVVNHLYGPVHARVKEHLKSLPEWYMAKTPPQEAARHVRTLLEARRSASHQVAVSVAPQYDASQRLVPGLYVVVVCAKDRRQLLDAITRCVSQHASISEATIVTTSDGFALDRFVLSLRPDDADSTIFDDLDMFGQLLKQDIEDILAAIPASPVVSPFTTLHGKGASKRKSGHPPPTVPETGQYTGQFEVPFQEIRLVRVLGEGRTGKTYLAEWNGQRVAAKVMSIDDSAPQASGKKIKSNLDEFRRELHLVSKLDHPNIVQFMGASARPPRYLLLFELCEGDIGTLIRQKDRKYSFFQMALDIANGLAFLHRNDIIHRDVKPENIMLDRQGVVKVADFGLSCYASGAGAEFTAETGTYRYMAPEVMRHERYSFPADVYSFALVCYVLLTRRLPFEDFTPLQAAMAVARQDARPKLPGNAPKAVTDLIMRCWSRDPSRRPDFETVIEVLEDARQQLNNRNRKLFDWGFNESKKKKSSSAFAAVTTALTATAI